MRDEIELLKEARPHAGGPPPKSSGRPGHRSAADREPRRPHRWRRRRVLGLAAPALAAAVAAVVLGITLTGNGSDQAWAAALVRVAEAAPRLLVDEDGWEITRADQFSVDYGEMTLAKDGQELEIKWMPGSEYAQAVGKRDAELDDLGTASAADGEARLFRYRGTSDYVALWLRGDYLVEARGLASDTDAFKAVLASLHEVDVDTWPRRCRRAWSSRPARRTSSKTCSQGSAAARARLEVDPDDRCRPGSLSAGRTGRGHGGLRVDRPVVGARRVGDEAAAREAVDAMSTSRTWPVLQEMNEEGDYPEVLGASPRPWRPTGRFRRGSR